MNKNFLPFEESMYLKELGFIEPCLANYYVPEKELTPYRGFPDEGNEDTHFSTCINQDYKTTWITAPLFQQAFNFFRDVFNLEYNIIKSANGNYSVAIHENTREYLDKIIMLGGHYHACLSEIVDLYSYEEAELECVRELIKLSLEKQKDKKNV
jgi:hypothetical protein